MALPTLAQLEAKVAAAKAVEEMARLAIDASGMTHDEWSAAVQVFADARIARMKLEQRRDNLQSFEARKL